jgi:hypothetical protein
VNQTTAFSWQYDMPSKDQGAIMLFGRELLSFD